MPLLPLGAFALLFVLVRPVDELAPLFVGGRTDLLAPVLIAAASLSALVVGAATGEAVRRTDPPSAVGRPGRTAPDRAFRSRNAGER